MVRRGNTLYEVEVYRKKSRRHANQLRPREDVATTAADVLFDTFDIPRSPVVEELHPDPEPAAPPAESIDDGEEERVTDPPRRSERARNPPVRLQVQPRLKTYL